MNEYYYMDYNIEIYAKTHPPLKDIMTCNGAGTESRDRGIPDRTPLLGAGGYAAKALDAVTRNTLS